MSHRLQPSVIDRMPDSLAISAQMSENLRENRLLRQLLRLAKRVEQERSERMIEHDNADLPEARA